MSCPSCCCAPAGTTCNTCGSFITVENGPVQPVRTVKALRGSDRNGLPRDLEAIPSSIPAADVGGDIKMRDGSTANPINLLQLRQVLAATGGVVVIDANGNLALIPKSTADTFLVTQAGVVQWSEVMPRANLLRESELSPNRSRLLTIGCATDGLVEIGFLDLSETDYIGVDSEGKPVARTFCDADAVDTFDAIFGCSNGIFSKINGSAGKKLVINDDGKFELVDAASDKPTWITPVTVCSKKVGYVLATDLPIYDAQIDVPFGGVYSGTFDMTTIPTYVEGSSVAICRCIVACNIMGSGVESHAKVLINNVMIIEGWMDTVDVFGFQNTLICEAPLTDDQFDFECYATQDGTGGSKSFSKLEIIGFK